MVPPAAHDYGFLSSMPGAGGRARCTSFDQFSPQKLTSDFASIATIEKLRKRILRSRNFLRLLKILRPNIYIYIYIHFRIRIIIFSKIDYSDILQEKNYYHTSIIQYFLLFLESNQ